MSLSQPSSPVEPPSAKRGKSRSRTQIALLPDPAPGKRPRKLGLATNIKALARVLEDPGAPLQLWREALRAFCGDLDRLLEFCLKMPRFQRVDAAAPERLLVVKEDIGCVERGLLYWFDMFIRLAPPISTDDRSVALSFLMEARPDLAALPGVQHLQDLLYNASEPVLCVSRPFLQRLAALVEVALAGRGEVKRTLEFAADVLTNVQNRDVCADLDVLDQDALEHVLHAALQRKWGYLPLTRLRYLLCWASPRLLCGFRKNGPLARLFRATATKLAASYERWKNRPKTALLSEMGRDAEMLLVYARFHEEHLLLAPRILLKQRHICLGHQGLGRHASLHAKLVGELQPVLLHLLHTLYSQWKLRGLTHPNEEPLSASAHVENWENAFKSGRLPLKAGNGLFDLTDMLFTTLGALNALQGVRREAFMSDLVFVNALAASLPALRRFARPGELWEGLQLWSCGQAEKTRRENCHADYHRLHLRIASESECLSTTMCDWLPELLLRAYPEKCPCYAPDSLEVHFGAADEPQPAGDANSKRWIAATARQFRLAFLQRYRTTPAAGAIAVYHWKPHAFSGARALVKREKQGRLLNWLTGFLMTVLECEESLGYRLSTLLLRDLFGSQTPAQALRTEPECAGSERLFLAAAERAHTDSDSEGDENEPGVDAEIARPDLRERHARALDPVLPGVDAAFLQLALAGLADSSTAFAKDWFLKGVNSEEEEKVMGAVMGHVRLAGAKRVGLLLKFVTDLDALPTGGAACISPPLTCKFYDSERPRWPVAHPCANQLSLPDGSEGGKALYQQFDAVLDAFEEQLQHGES